MRDDVSAIPTTGCNYLSNSETIYNYSGNVRRTFRQVGGKWFFTEQSTYQTIPTNYQCIDLSELSSYSVYEPFLYFISFCLFIVVVYVFFYCVRKLVYAIRV